MKKLYFLLTFCYTMAIQAQTINIPDANFLAKLLQASPTTSIAYNQSNDKIKIDINNSGTIEVNESLLVYKLVIPNSSISDLTGIESFTNLINLDCGSNQLTTLNVSALTSLYQLQCSYNPLISINLNGLNNLHFLYCNYTQLETLDTSNLIGLAFLNCSNNQLTSLILPSALNDDLWSIKCNNNLLTSLDISGYPNLNEIQCQYNNLTTLTLSGLTNLDELNCSYNNLSNLSLSNVTYLSNLNCSNNQLTSLNLSGMTISLFSCSNNQLTTLDLSEVRVTNSLGCTSMNTLVWLSIKNGFNDTTNMYLDSGLRFICVDQNEMPFVQSYVNEAYGPNPNICTVNTYCSFVPGGDYYTIEGNNRYDFNNNECDSSDSNLPNLKLNITSGTSLSSVLSNITGSYIIPVQSGTHSITPQLENPTYFTISPTSFSVTFPAAPSPFDQNFCVTPNGTHNDLEVLILPVNLARPGFDAEYKIIYKNKGTHLQSGTLNVTFDDAVLDFISADTTPASQVLNSLTWNFNNLEPFEIREIGLVMNLNSPTEIPALNGGSVLNYYTSIVGLTDETPIDNESNLKQTVVNAYDPNDKTCLEGATITPDKVGEYVHYLIRFENTGTANAQNVVVKDLIDVTKFDVTTLIPIDGSHEFYTRITNTNQVEFIFENIQLPFDDANNDGYIAFKIRTKPTLVAGNTFSNTASIYFDYNFPIITNTATTVIQALSNPDFEFSNYIQLTPNPAKDVLNITSKMDIEISSISIYNSLGQLVLVIPNANETASIDVSQLTSGTYFVKVLSDKGSSNSKFIKQ